jgi:hypothetical protein
MIADLLDPKGSHGQGPLFLGIFLDVIGHPELSVRFGTAILLNSALTISRGVRSALRKIPMELQLERYIAVLLAPQRNKRGIEPAA